MKPAKNADSPRNAYGAATTTSAKQSAKNDKISAPRNLNAKTRFPFSGLSIDVDSESDEAINAPKVPVLAGKRRNLGLPEHQISSTD